jgi:hypothetical protein
MGAKDVTWGTSVVAAVVLVTVGAFEHPTVSRCVPGALKAVNLKVQYHRFP